MMRNLKLNCNILCVTKSELEFSVKGSETTPRDSSKLRVEVLLETLLVQHKCGHTNNIKHVYDMNNKNNARYIKRELEREIQTQTPGYVSRFEPLLYVPAFT